MMTTTTTATTMIKQPSFGSSSSSSTHCANRWKGTLQYHYQPPLWPLSWLVYLPVTVGGLWRSLLLLLLAVGERLESCTVCRRRSRVGGVIFFCFVLFYFAALAAVRLCSPSLELERSVGRSVAPYIFLGCFLSVCVLCCYHHTVAAAAAAAARSTLR